MSVEIILERFRAGAPKTAQQEQHLLREILQEIALSALARAGFFKQGAFHGGTCLRILHGVRRFSEDLDFVLKEAHADFDWSRYERVLVDEFGLYGVELEIRDRASQTAIQALWLKDQSLGKILDLKHPLRSGQKITVKLEVDCNPPAGSIFETGYVNFPVPFSLLAQDLESGFASKLHALLCRDYVKGRDWYDLTWYVGRRIRPRLKLLENAIDQQGPWAGQKQKVDSTWLIAELGNKTAAVDFRQAQKDVERFLDEPELRGLEVWGQNFFRMQVKKLEEFSEPSSL
jgi:predicted nucleotidyltransferase component of viral defense system